MSIQLPSLSQEQQQALIKRMQMTALYPITMRVNRTATAGHFPTSDAAGGGSYIQTSWTPPTSIGIAGITSSFFQVFATFYRQIGAVSLLSTFTMGDIGATLTVPNDIGNLLWLGSFFTNNLNGYTPFLPSNYYVQANVPIYFYFWVETAAIGSGTTYIGSITLHTIQTTVQV